MIRLRMAGRMLSARVKERERGLSGETRGRGFADLLVQDAEALARADVVLGRLLLEVVELLLEDGRVRQFFEEARAPDQWQTWFEGFYSRVPSGDS